ncbi:MAG: threonine--tRNA ligase [Candidatus Magasanikbacteria bacterium RIFOXYC2_FULL_40_16]|uniref:Threonine--tRNA ligase n=2 Tax=Candidatus Magasanikiibacteriota TaxID=1752731 RepID=A0A1F6NFF2_9BACT|nr:MAG: threonine--tRNA ligase [Candidatus Magasanikbacteria bacterium RIFOXYA2_FULL_40_20]OGH82602.1 MAG: threonine--tRNA ligase [Candidatus Magasanikbacteria bacterium RIFOXYB1_FULL_40_15]OGH86409.1 MAG: threonine--tRNA ligase [Candidatus Magasanikbacteria bacterium RIFOXYB2_FULL_40_13]OGH89724.1 MAG: threonine--tRNA ligase [Candidatus Magasanikbacteria bacterium RIFOXYC2_FULL_40_16]
MTEEQIHKARHSASHMLAAAVLELYPGTKLGIGPVIENGFYYDFQFPEGVVISDADLKDIEKKMKHLIKQGHKFARKEMSADEARKQEKGEKFKLELIDELDEKGEQISFYESGPFHDLCAGPHVESTKEIPADGLKLEKIAGAYWRGDEKREMLTRIYGLLFATRQELDDYLKMMEEAKKRDHRKLGKELEIFIFDDEVGPGLPLWLPNGTIIADQLQKLAEEKELEYGYMKVRTPHIAKEELYLRSGHLPYYAESMFPPMEMDNEKYYLKAMNCPHHHKIYASKMRSYRDLPLRLAEYGHCYRFEDSGSLFGLMRVRSMAMNDAHIYCSEEQFEAEFVKVLDLYKFYFDIFGIERYQMRLSKHSKEGLGKKYVDNENLWIKTEELVRSALKNSGIPFVEAEDEAAFYGPKIDVQIWSVIGREFTLSTNQLDFAVPDRFNLKYTDSDGTEKTPICIHRAPLSTHERMIGFLLEHYAGAFPVWLSPVQVQFAPVSEKHVEGAGKIAQEFRNAGIRVGLDSADETVGNKVRKAVAQKIPYILVIGDKELAGEDLMIRVRGKEDQEKMSKEKFLERVKKESKNRNA